MYQTLQVTEQDALLTIQLNRPQHRNSLNQTMLQEFLTALEYAEMNPNNRMILLKGQTDYFCTGADLNEVAEQHQSIEAEIYMTLLQRLSTMPRIVITCVSGAAIAGGVGLAAASDLVIASPTSKFGLSEVLWGLLPCCVIPYLIRRIGFQAAYRLTLTAETISGEAALNLGLVDRLVTNIDDEVRKQSLRFLRLHPETIADLKRYFQKMWLINESMERVAIAEITRLMKSSRVKKNLVNYMQRQIFPWEVETELA